MALDEMNPFVRDDVFPSWFVNAIQKFLSTAAFGFSVQRQDATHIIVPAGLEEKAAAITIKGKWRWVEAAVTRAHPGGGAGTYDIFVVAKNNSIVAVPAPGTDTTDYTFDLRILAAGGTPPIEAGVVDAFRKVGTLAWDGAAITRVTQSFVPTPTHADTHATGGVDPITPADIGAAPAAALVAQEATHAAYSQDTLAKRPAPGQVNRLFKATDTGGLFHDTGSAWEALATSAGQSVVSWGVIEENGTVTASSGDFTVAKEGTSSYKITWTPTKATGGGRGYAIALNPAGLGGYGTVSARSGASFTAIFYSKTGVETAPGSFFFIVVAN